MADEPEEEEDFSPVETTEREIVTGEPVEPPALLERAKAVKAVRDELQARQDAYRRWWAGKSIGDDNKIVANDLRKFCRAEQSAYNDNERIHVLLTGRQEVWYRISDHVHLDFETLVERYTTVQ